MLFNSMHFLLFFPIVTILYFIIPHKFRWIWLLLTSYYFYMSWNPKYALLMATSTVITYLSGVLIDRANRLESKKKREFRRKLWVALSFSSNIIILMFFKYFGFAVSNLKYVLSLIGIHFTEPTFNVLLPVGISFYTFQALSYTMDVYRNEIYAEKNLAKYALFVSFFPQLVAGPIERSKNLLVQINEKHFFDYYNVKNGLLLMAWGYFQKLVIADRVAILVNTVYDNYNNYGGFSIAVATVFFAIQIYCDFSAYTNIAKGAAQVMGFRLMDNFNQPYFATSIQDFWRRWHISLSTWFRDYLYIPLGGSRCSKLRKYFNLMVTFLVSGLWHGASMNYVFWGGVHGTYQIVGDIIKPLKDKLYIKLKINTEAQSFKFGKMFTTFVLVNIAWFFFRASNLMIALVIIKKMFLHFDPHDFFDGSLYKMGLNQDEFIIAVFAIIVLLLFDVFSRKHNIFDKLSSQNMVFRWVSYFVLLWSILLYGVYGIDYVQTQFIYFQF